MSETSAGPSRGRLQRSTIGSSTVAIGTATAFIAIAAGLSFVADDGPARSATVWTLRGSLASEPSPPMPVAKRQQVAERQQVARSD